MSTWPASASRRALIGDAETTVTFSAEQLNVPLPQASPHTAKLVEQQCRMLLDSNAILSAVKAFRSVDPAGAVSRPDHRRRAAVRDRQGAVDGREWAVRDIAEWAEIGRGFTIIERPSTVPSSSGSDAAQPARGR